MVNRAGQFLIALAMLSAPTIASARGPAISSVIALDSPLAHGEYAWDDTGVAPGPVRIVIDLATEKLHVYRAGVEIGRAYILYGADQKPTPTGVFRILEKDRDHVSNLYNAPMPYMLRLTWDGVAIHGSEVEYNAATHGCVGVPDEFAALLFDQARKGTEVLVTRNWRPDLYHDEAPALVSAEDQNGVGEPVIP